MSHPVILDFNSLARRCCAASALEDLKTGAKPTGGIYGTLSMLTTLLNSGEVDADRIIACVDCGVPAFRMSCIPAYKANREEKRKMMTPEDEAQVYGQLDDLLEILPLLGVTILRYEDMEADDIVAACTRVFAAEGEAPLIVTGDKDLYQLLNVSVLTRLYDLNAKKFYTAHTAHEDYRVPISCWILYKALQGDKSDNIDGVAGIGPAIAAGLIEAASTMYNERTGGKLFEYLSPGDQLRELRNIIEDGPVGSRKKYMAAFLVEYPRLCNVIAGIDLSESFGGTRSLRQTIMEDNRGVDVMRFLGRCKALQFESVLGNPKKWTAPFILAKKRRDTKPVNPLA
jgi:DNA polymerase-1